MDQLTPEKKKAISKLVAKHFVRSLLTGINYGGILFLLNFIFFMASQIFFEGDQTITMIMSVLGSIFVLTQMSSVINERHRRLKEELEKITKSE